MVDEPDVRSVDAHSEREVGRVPTDIATRPLLLDLRLVVWRHVRVVTLA
jgi:hypothetical protein